MKNIILTTTDNVSNKEISEYLDIITSNLVVGTNVFSDFIASFSDFFGGTSGTYTNQMDSLYSKAKAVMIKKALSINADAVVGIRMDFDEINGKGKAMFMVSISGTAVKFKNTKIENTEYRDSVTISAETLNKQLFQDSITRKMEKNSIPSLTEWNHILNFNLVELLPLVYKTYIYRKVNDDKYQNDPDYNEKLDTKMTELLLKADTKDAEDVLYGNFLENNEYANPLIQKCHLFSPKHVYALLAQDGGLHEIIALLHTKYEKSYYTEEDIEYMHKIVSFIENLPDKGKIEEVKTGLLSSKVEKKYICENGHKNDINIEYCTSCGVNIKGLTSDEVETINSFKQRINALETILKN